MKKVISTLALALVLVMCLSITAMAYSGEASVTLKNTENEAISAVLACHAAKATATNRADSNHSVSAALQLSAGNGWSNYGTVTMQPGSTGNTGTWGRADTVYLCRVQLWIPGLPQSGCTATATMTVTE